MTFPTRPSIDIPRWCLLGNKIEPNPYGPPGSGGYEDTGWLQISGQNYGQIPPYQWVNWLQYSVGEWLDWLCNPTITTTTGAIEYIQLGNFDNNIIAGGKITAGNNLSATQALVLANGCSMSFYESTNVHPFVLSYSGSISQGYTLPPMMPNPAQTLQILAADPSGMMFWQNTTVNAYNNFTTTNIASAGFSTLQSFTLLTGKYLISIQVVTNDGHAINADIGISNTTNSFNYYNIYGRDRIQFISADSNYTPATLNNFFIILSMSTVLNVLIDVFTIGGPSAMINCNLSVIEVT